MLKTIIKSAVCVLFALTSLSLRAQDRTVTGKVLGPDGLPLMGTAVIQEGTTNGTMTGDDGSYSIKLPSADVILTFSSLGYETQNVPVTARQSVCDVTLAEDSQLLEETVVVGYGVQKKVNLTGSVTAVDGKVFADRTTGNLSTMLQGSVPGLNISTSSGNPGSTGTLNIRGFTSINGAEPLVLVDGVIGEIDRVNPNDVESISVIKDAAAAAVYGARAAYGVILVTTKSGKDVDGKATVRFSGRWGWQEPTTTTDYETRGYWSVYTVDKFWMTDAGKKYTTYTDYDMAQLLARVNDVTENPERPWVVEDIRGGRRQWVYYCNTDWYHELFNDVHPQQQYNVSVNGGNKAVRYYLSGGYDRQVGIIKANPDVFQKYNLRAKIDINLNKWVKLSNNTAFYRSTYDYPGPDSDIQNSFAYVARHALASFPLKNPDGSWVYGTPMISGSYNVGNGRHAIFGDGIDTNLTKKTDFQNTTELTIKPVEQVNIVGNFTYRMNQNLNTNRTAPFYFRRYPDSELESYSTGAGLDELSERTRTYDYITANVFANFEDTWADAHHFTAVAGMNLETYHYKNVTASGQNLLSTSLNDLNLVGTDATGAVITSVAGGQNGYSMAGFFGRLNYDYKGRYLLEVSARYDGTSRFAEGHRWGFFPSVSAGWRISEEPFFEEARQVVNNLKLRGSYGTLGNQNVGYYDYLRVISISDYTYSFNESTSWPKKSSLSAPVAGDLTWETSQQYNVGLDLAMFQNRLEFTGEAYIRDTKNMLTDGMDLPGVYGGSVPKMNAADLSTKGYELSLGWRDEFNLAGKPFSYGIKGSISNSDSYITRFNNKDKILSNYYEGMHLGEIWGYEVNGLFKTDEEAKDYVANVCDCSMINSRMTGGFLAGDLRFEDLDKDGKLSVGANTADDPGDRKILGNSYATLQYGFNLNLGWMGFDVSAFFQGTGDHYWYPSAQNMSFWGTYSYPYVSFLQRDFIKRCWSEDNPDAYFPRPRAYSSSGGELAKINSYYLQNLRYLRFKNLTVGYTVPQKVSRVIGMEKVRVYFTGENLAYWSPFYKNCAYIDPESAFSREGSTFNVDSSAYDHIAYPWQKTFMFGVEITF